MRRGEREREAECWTGGGSPAELSLSTPGALGTAGPARPGETFPGCCCCCCRLCSSPIGGASEEGKERAGCIRAGGAQPGLGATEKAGKRHGKARRKLWSLQGISGCSGWREAPPPALGESVTRAKWSSGGWESVGGAWAGGALPWGSPAPPLVQQQRLPCCRASDPSRGREAAAAACTFGHLRCALPASQLRAPSPSSFLRRCPGRAHLRRPSRTPGSLRRRGAALPLLRPPRRKRPNPARPAYAGPSAGCGAGERRSRRARLGRPLRRARSKTSA